MSVLADDISVPQGGAEDAVDDNAYDLNGDPFSYGKADARVGLLTRSVSRKRLSPEALAAGAEEGLAADGVFAAYDDAAMSALLLGYESCPGVGHHPDAFRITRRMRADNGAREVNRAAEEALSRSGIHARVAGAGQIQHPRLASEPEVLPHEVPVLGPAQADATVTTTTAGSAFVTAATSAGHVPSAPPPPWRSHCGKQPYGDLLSGPGFSYAADGDEVFDTDAISLGSLASGSDFGDGYMLGSEDEDEDVDEDCSDFRLSRSRSAGTVCSGSGERFEADATRVAVDAVGAADVPHPDQSYGGIGDVDAAAAAAVQLDVVAASAVAAADGGAAAAITAGAAVGDIGSPREELRTGAVAEEEEEGGPAASAPMRSDSSESVGSADMVDCMATSCASRPATTAASVVNAAGLAPPPALAAAAGFGAAAVGGEPGIPFNLPVAAAAAPLLLPLPGVPPLAAVALGGGAAAASVGVTAAAGAPSGAWVSVGPPELQHPAAAMTGDASAAATAAATALPLAGAVAPLLPPEVYLGFISQLVESVRSAARAVDQACQAERQGGGGGYGFAGNYAAPFGAVPTGGAGTGAMRVTGGDARDGGGMAVAGGVDAGTGAGRTVLVPSRVSSSAQGQSLNRGAAALGVVRRGAAGA